VINHIGWGGKITYVADDFDMGRGAYRNVPAFGIRRAIWDAAYGWVNGFRLSSIVYYVCTRSLSQNVMRWALRREGVPNWESYDSLPLVRTTQAKDT
jgi:hypothetical protein